VSDGATTTYPAKVQYMNQTTTNHVRIKVLFGVAPIAYDLDSRSDFSPVKYLSFEISIDKPVAFRKCALSKPHISSVGKHSVPNMITIGIPSHLSMTINFNNCTDS